MRADRKKSSRQRDLHVLVRAGLAGRDVEAQRGQVHHDRRDGDGLLGPRQALVEVAADALRVPVVGAQRVEQRLRCGRPPAAASCSRTPSVSWPRLAAARGSGWCGRRPSRGCTFAPPGESSTDATSPGCGDRHRRGRGDLRRRQQRDGLVDGRGTSRAPGAAGCGSACRRGRRPSLVRRRFRQTPRPASLSPILASVPASRASTNQPWPCLDDPDQRSSSDRSGCQSQFWASRPPAPTTEHSVGPSPARISVRALTASSACSVDAGAVARSRTSSSCAQSGTRHVPGRDAGLGEHPLDRPRSSAGSRRVRASERLPALARRGLVRAVDCERHPVTKAATSPCVANHTSALSTASRRSSRSSSCRAVAAPDHLGMHRERDVPALAHADSNSASHVSRNSSAR